MINNNILYMECLRCHKKMSSNRYALSRVDNRSKICSTCENEESMLEFTYLNIRKDLDKHTTIDKLQQNTEILVKMKVHMDKTSLTYQHIEKMINILTERIEQIENSE